MTPEEVRALVFRQIGGQWARRNAHGCDLRECLVDPPERLALVKAIDETNTEGWLVLRKNAAGGPGYAVVYHEEPGEFGLTQFAEGWAPCLLGLYGEFFDAFDAM
jgi:hypothetical protein